MLMDGHAFQWSIIPILVVVVYAYVEQIAARRWNVVFAGLAFWLMDWINEIINALINHFTNHPVWGTPSASSLTILVGLNIEITLMFAMMGLLAVRLLPVNRSLAFYGINNRLWFAAINSVLCVLVELELHHLGALQWYWSWWNTSFPFLIWLFGYMPFFLVAYWVFDMPSTAQQRQTVSRLFLTVCLALILFGPVLNWL